MPTRPNAIARVSAAGIAALVLVVSAPGSALAADEGIWTRWAREVTDRSIYEVPFVILFSLPAMLVTTPFYWGELAVEKLKGDE